MSVYTIFALVNICLAVLLGAAASTKLPTVHRKNLKQSISSAIILAVCFIVMNTLVILRPPEVAVEVFTILRESLDMLSMIVLLSLVRALPVARQGE